MKRFSACPCEANCLDGCKDCDNPVCLSVLVLNTSPYYANMPLMIGFDGKFIL